LWDLKLTQFWVALFKKNATKLRIKIRYESEYLLGMRKLQISRTDKYYKHHKFRKIT